MHLIYFPSSDFRYLSVTKFNEYLRDSKESVSLFKRNDCVPVKIESCPIVYEPYGSKNNRWVDYLKLVLLSDMFVSKMNVTEKVQLMVLALERIKYNEYDDNPFTIMISIMLSSNYTPFVEDIKPKLRQTFNLYEKS